MWKHYLAGAAISLAAGYWFLRMVDLEAMAQAMGQVHAVWLIPCLAFYILSYYLRAIRWHYLMRPVARVPIMPLFASILIGFLGNNILPAHLGEVARAYVLGKSQGVSRSATFATVVLERVYDGLTVLMFLVVVLIFMDLPEGAVEGSMITVASLRTAGWLGFAFFAGALILLQVLRWQRSRTLAVCRFCLRPAPQGIRDRVLAMVDSFADGLALARAGDQVMVAVMSIAVWLCLAMWAWSLFPAFGLDLGPMAGILMQVVVALALLIPAAPAFVGTFHLAAAATLAFLGADGGIAGSYAMLLWLVHFVVTTVLGLFFLWRMGLGLKALNPSAASD